MPGRRPKALGFVSHPFFRLSLGLSCVVALYLYVASVGFEPGSPAFLIPAASTGSLDVSGDDGAQRIVPLTSADQRNLRRQREIVDGLARRYVGTSVAHGSVEDLRVLQELLDQEVLKSDQTFELQSLGVVLGDVMAKQLELSWVRVEDALGRSRALRLDGTDVLFFPVTMISKRVEADVEFTVAELYLKAKAGAERDRAN